MARKSSAKSRVEPALLLRIMPIMLILAWTAIAPRRATQPASGNMTVMESETIVPDPLR